MKNTKDIRQEPEYQELVKLIGGMSEDRRAALGQILETEMEKDFMTTREAAKKLHIEPVTVRLWLLEGRLKGRKFGGRWRVSIKDVERMLNNDAVDETCE